MIWVPGREATPERYLPLFGAGSDMLALRKSVALRLGVYQQGFPFAIRQQVISTPSGDVVRDITVAMVHLLDANDQPFGEAFPEEVAIVPDDMTPMTGARLREKFYIGTSPGPNSVLSIATTKHGMLSGL